MKSILYSLLLAVSTGAGAAEFSVYLVPVSHDGSPQATLGLREDLNIDVNGKTIPIHMKEARQTITYPCAAGGTVQFFRVIAKGDQKVREVLGSTAVPDGANTGVIVLVQRDGKLVVNPLWWSSSELDKGTGVFVNLTGRDLGLVCVGKRQPLKANKRLQVSLKASGAETIRSTRVEIYAQGEPKGAIQRILDQSVGIPQHDTGIYLIIPKMNDYVTLVPLEAGGLRDPIAKEELRKVVAEAKDEGARRNAYVPGQTQSCAR